MKKKISAMLLILTICLGVCVAVLYVVDVPSIASEQEVSAIGQKDPELSEEQKKALEELKEKGNEYVRYLYQEQEILNSEDPLLTRLTRDDFKTILASEKNFKVIESKIKAKQPYPDVIVSMDVSLPIYWLDGVGKESIWVLEWSGRIYYNAVIDGKKKNALIFDRNDPSIVGDIDSIPFETNIDIQLKWGLIIGGSLLLVATGVFVGVYVNKKRAVTLE